MPSARAIQVGMKFSSYRGSDTFRKAGDFMISEDGNLRVSLDEHGTVFLVISDRVTLTSGTTTDSVTIFVGQRIEALKERLGRAGQIDHTQQKDLGPVSIFRYRCKDSNLDAFVSPPGHIRRLVLSEILPSDHER